jgi:PKD repeat protein
MSQTRPTRIRLLLALSACAFALAALAAQASAAPYGELLRFGKAGNKSGQFVYSATEHALGVDPTDHSVYVGDEVKAGNKATEYRIQKFSSAGSPLASVNFTVENEAGEGGAPNGLEGIAVDPSLGRIYVLVEYERLEEEGPKGAIRLDPEVDAAGMLYAFSTTPSAGKLVPAEGTTNGVLANKEVLEAQSEVAGKRSESALLEPSGIAVDPTTKDIVILGQEDQGGETLLVAAQRVHSTGALGARWVDTTQCFVGEVASPSCPAEPGEEPASVGVEPTSPVVLPNGKVLVDMLESQVWEIPQSFTTGEAPKQLLAFGEPQQNLIEFPGALDPKEGGGMSYARESSETTSEGRLYVYANVTRTPSGSETKSKLPAVLSFKLGEAGGTTAFSELGWTGGTSKAEHEECAINFLKQPTIAADTGETVYVFDPAKPTIVEEQHGSSVNPHVDKFGPTGKGCPSAAVTKEGLKVTQNGTEVGSEKTPIEAGKKVALTLNLEDGNAREATWSFGDGSASGKSGYEFLSPSIEHVFTAAGAHEITATIATDTLASPTVTAKATIFVKAATPVAQFSGPSEANVAQTVTFDAKGSTDPNGKALKYAWKFGDGKETTTTSSSVTHEYAALGTYSVTLTVSDEIGTSAPATHSIKIVTPSTTEPAPGPLPGPPGGGTTTTTSTIGTVAPPPGGGVHGFKAGGNPEAKIAGSSLTTTPGGSFSVKVSCPAGETSCTGTITLKTLTAVSASTKKKAILTLAGGSFSVAGGASKSLTLHLSSAAKKLLAHAHVLRAKATVVAHDATGASRTTTVTVTLKPGKSKHR